MAQKRCWQESENGLESDGDSSKQPKLSLPFSSEMDETKTPDELSSSVENGEPKEVVSQGKKKKRKNPVKGSTNYPELHHSHNARLQTNVKISDLQNLILYILADGTAPQWVAVRHHGAIQRVVALTVPGLDPELFSGKTPLSEIGEDTKPTEDSEAPSTVSVSADEPIKTNETILQPEAQDEVKDRKAAAKKLNLSPDDYYPKSLSTSNLPRVLKPLADMFPHIWPIKTPGDDKFSKIHSPMQAMLLTPLKKSSEDKKRKGPTVAKSMPWNDQPTDITEFVATAQQLEENGYVLHSALFDTDVARESVIEQRKASSQTAEDGWMDIVANASDKPTVESKNDRKVVAVDCEMCKTSEDKFELTRISALDWDGNTILDELVKPDRPIIDYVTPYSGITEEMLKPVTTRVEDIQKRLQEIITPSTIVIGHSLDSDLNALQMAHPWIVDTAIIYPHPRGPPLKSSLKWLTQKYLGRDIQQSSGSTGHDSVEDAKAVLDLVKQKCEKGPKWGTNESNNESVFTRIKKNQIPKMFQSDPEVEEPRITAVVDWGTPSRGLAANADLIVGCANDAEVAEGVINVLQESEKTMPHIPDLIWGRFREIEAVRGWWAKSKTIDNLELRQQVLSKFGITEEDVQSPDAATDVLSKVVDQTIKHIAEIYEALPPCTAFIVYSGHGDPRETIRLQALHQQFKNEYRTKKWDQLSVQWTDTEEQQLRKACKKARQGVAFMTIK